MRNILSGLNRTAGVAIGRTVESHALEQPSELPKGLPPEYLEFLCRSDGLTIFGGYFRMFGITSTLVPSVVHWNHPETWKFAWRGRCDRFWCFGATAFGDQYAFDLDEIARGGSQVYFLEGLGMASERLAASFQDFLVTELIRNSVEPYDSLTVLVRNAKGDIDPYQQLVYSPSPVIGGSESVDNLRSVDVFQGQIINGDIASQVDALENDSELVKVEEYNDHLGRTRVRLVWR